MIKLKNMSTDLQNGNIGFFFIFFDANTPPAPHAATAPPGQNTTGYEVTSERSAGVLKGSCNKN